MSAGDNTLLEVLERERAVADRVNTIVESSIQLHWPVEQLFEAVWPPLLAALGARSGAANSLDEHLETREWSSAPEEPWPPQARSMLDAAAALHIVADGESFLGYPLEVAGERLGSIAVRVGTRLDEKDATERLRCLAAAAEILDNRLAEIAASRRKQLAAQAVGEALQQPVLEDGLRAALDVVDRFVALGDLLLVFRQDSGLRHAAVAYKVLQRLSTPRRRSAGDGGAGDEIDRRAPDLLEGDPPVFLADLGLAGAEVFTVLASGRDRRPVAKLFVQSAKGRFNTQEEDLLRLFVDFLRQRLVDFQREWRHLSRSFSPADTARLLRVDDYHARHLGPQERRVAVLYADVCGFTRVSEQVLKEPALIAQLVDRFGEGSVQIVWEEGGVFDKMVGDCVIALFGPPFFEDEPKALCERALRAATRIREFARSLGAGDELPRLRGLEPPLGVATGLNFCPMYVGYFGPDDEYTGFSSGMNNTARLQGLASRDEIFCASGFVDALGAPERFAEEQATPVKNVGQPLRYRKLVG